MPPHTQSNPAEHDGEGRRDQARYRDKQEREIAAGNIPALAHYRQGISAQAEVSTMPESDIAAIARTDIPAGSRRRKHQGEDGEGARCCMGKQRWIHYRTQQENK